MNRIFLLMALSILFFSCSNNDSLVLVYSPQELQNSEASKTLLNDLLLQFEENKTKVVLADLTSFLVEDSLQQYASLVFFSLDPQQLDYRQQADLERYVQGGGSLLLMNVSEDTVGHRYAWPWYHELQQELLQRENKTAAALNGAPVNTIKYDGGTISYVPLSFGKQKGAMPAAKVLYEAITEDSKKPDFSKATSPRVPDANRFVTVVLDQDVNEPMQMAILPDERVLYIEREGLVKLYKPDEQKTKILARFEVSTEGNYEDGMLGITADPQFERNGWVYIYYSPKGGHARQNLSRFNMKGDSLLMQSEKLVMEVPVQRETCCHSAGGLEWGPDGYLYLSTGDNTSSKESNGYTPIDERPGRAPFDAQKSSSNTNDLRGKILRIKPEADGTYSIPEGNLFAKDGSQGRPEIYVMGARNPFRFTVDPANGYVYWGDVGPDGGQDGLQGPQSYDEWNQARKPGNYGWPYFVGNNKAYPHWDFTNNTPGPLFDPKSPLNESPNNTGSKALPPANGALIWYPYGPSPEFPVLGAGSRSAMGGPFYNAKQYGNSATKFPSYFNGKWFIYEWARSWIKVVSFDKDHNLAKIEDFMPLEHFEKPIDMRFGPDGSLYVLEYGANYFTNNEDARLVKIEYAEGNRAPVALLAASKKLGAAPLTVAFSAAESFDYDANEALRYEWFFTDAKTVASTEKSTNFTFQQPGTYLVTLRVTDANGESSTASQTIAVGNEPPVVEIQTEGNRSFFFDGGSLSYNINVQDKEDGKLNAGIDQQNLLINWDYLNQGKDLALINPEGGGFATEYLRGKQLVEASDCRSCHTLADASVGPTYNEIAKRYKGDYSAQEFLSLKIINGGGGNWGDRLMAAHPQHTKEETAEMAKYILSLANEKPVKASMPLQAKLFFNQHKGRGEEGSYIFTVAYRDKGANGIAPLSAREMLVLRHPKVQAENYDDFRNVQQQRPQGGSLAFVSNIRDGSFIMFKRIDLSNIRQISYQLEGQAGGTIELRLNTPDGPLVSSVTVPAGEPKRDFSQLMAPIQATSSQQDIFFVFKGENKEADLMVLDWIQFQPGKGAL